MSRRLFGKASPRRTEDFGGLPVLGTWVDDDSLKLTLDEVHQLAKASAEQRGFPAPASDTIAQRVIWLERRRLPGLTAWIFELSNHRDESLAERLRLLRPDGTEGRSCPIFFGVKLEEMLDDLTSGEPGRSKIFRAPSHPILLLPKIAAFLGPLGRMVLIKWYRDRDEILCTTMDGHRIAHQGDSGMLFEAIMHADWLGISPYPEADRPVPPMESGNQSDVILLRPVLGTLINFMRATA
jgi:hypothetical protein